MKRASIVVALLIAPIRAYADVPVIDFAGLTQSVKSYFETAQQTVLQNSIVANTLDTFHEVQHDVAQVTKVYEQANQIYNAASHISSAGSAYSYLMGQLGDPIPFSPYQIEGLFNGRVSAGGLGSLGTAFSSAQRLNTVWLPANANSQAAQDMSARITTVSAQQAISDQQMTSAQARMPALQGLVDQLAVTKDPADREALMIRIQGAQAQISAAQLEAQTTAQMAAAAKDAQDLREQQSDQKALIDVADRMHTVGQW